MEGGIPGAAVERAAQMEPTAQLTVVQQALGTCQAGPPPALQLQQPPTLKGARGILRSMRDGEAREVANESSPPMGPRA